MKIELLGPVSVEGSVYVGRDIDAQVLVSLERNEYINIRGGRQTGKTSLILRLRRTLEERGASSSYIDLSTMADVEGDMPTWLDLFGDALSESIYPIPAGEEMPEAPITVDGLRDYLYRVARALAERHPLVVFIDEVTAAPDAVRQPLFAAIRAMYNMRTDVTAPPEAREVIFVFAGTFDPERMIVGKNSPFNIARDFDTSKYDFGLPQIEEVANCAGIQGLSEPILLITGGHPYLTNRLVCLLSEGFSLEDAQSEILAEDSNLRHIGHKLRELPPSVFEMVMKLIEGEKAQCILGLSEDLDQLIVFGLVKPDLAGDAVIRCSLYAEYISRMAGMRKERGFGFRTQ